MKRVLLTGASGFIGRHTLAPLAACGYEVHAISSRPAPVELPAKNWHQADLLDEHQMSSVMAKVRPTHLLNFAWYAEPGKFWRSAENFRWLEASIALLRLFFRHGGARVVMAGTCAEYDWAHGFCSEAATPCRPATPYGVCKNAMQEALRAYCALEGLSGAWGRIFYLYGPHEHRARLISSVFVSLLRGQTARCTHGSQIRDFLHVEDVASAFVALLDGTVEGPVNICSGRPITLSELVLAAADCLGTRDRVEFGALSAPDGEPPLLVGDNRRLSDEVGWSPRFNVRDGIEQTARWWKAKIDEEKS